MTHRGQIADKWLTIGESASPERVWAVQRVEYGDGPPESRYNDYTIGTVPMDLLDTIDVLGELHDDTTLLLSALDDDPRAEIEEAFEVDPTLNQLADRAADSTPTQALDGYALDNTPLNAREWAELTDRDRSTVARNAGRADD